MIFIDSDFIIDYLRGNGEIIDIIDNYSDNIATTEINVFEVMLGLHLKKNVSEKQIKAAKDFFNIIPVFFLNQGCGEKAAEIFSNLIKEGKGIDQNDCLIAAIILKNGHDKIVTSSVP